MATIKGYGEPPALVIAYVRGLPDTSATTALMRGGWQFHGWGEDRAMQAEMHDLLAAAHFKDVQPWPRPKKDANSPKPKKRSLVEVFRHLGGAGRRGGPSGS